MNRSLRGWWKRGAAAGVLLALLGVLGMVAEQGQAQAGKGEKIAFARLKFADKASAIYLINADGSGETRVGKGDALEMDPALSPDGKRVAFTVMTIDAMKGDLYIMNVDGSDRKQLTKQEGQSLAFSPSWSPDGKRILYSTIRIEGQGPPKDMTVMAMDADGKNAKKVADGIMSAWSPDGKRIMVTVLDDKDNDMPRLHVMDADGKNAKKLVETMSMMGAWSPDGKRVVYLGAGDGKKGEPDIFVMNVDGSGQTQLTKTEKVLELAPRFSANGKQIYFNRVSTKGGPPKSVPILVMDADGKNEKQISKDDNADLMGAAAIFMTARTRESKPPPIDKKP